jgi:hypothetical protein
MPTLSLITKYKKNERSVLSAEELLSLYFYAVAINNSTDGTKLQKETIELYDIEFVDKRISKLCKLFFKLDYVITWIVGIIIYKFIENGYDHAINEKSYSSAPVSKIVKSFKILEEMNAKN